MASCGHIDKDLDFGGVFIATMPSGTKRSFGDLDDDEDYIFGSKKDNLLKVEETTPGAATRMILSLCESLQDCKDTLASCQTELESAKSEIQKWRAAFEKESFVPSGLTPEPKSVVSYLQNLRSSEESLREQLEIAKKKEAAFIVTFAKREQEIAGLKVRDLRAQLKPPFMLNLVEEKDKKVKELHDNIVAVNFTPQSKMGKMLMAKCRTLQEENEEIGNQANEGKAKSQNTELKSQFEGLCKQMDCRILQDKLEEISKLKEELNGRNTVVEKAKSTPDKSANDEEMTTTEASGVGQHIRGLIFIHEATLLSLNDTMVKQAEDEARRPGNRAVDSHTDVLVTAIHVIFCNPSLPY